VGGVTAAMVAVDAGVATTLFDKEPEPFSRHQTCRRWVDPTQYDWPLGHYAAGRIPWPSPTPPLPLPAAPLMPPPPTVPLAWPRANRAIALVGDWRAQFNAFRLSPNATTYLTWRHDAEVQSIRPDASGTMVDVTWKPTTATTAPTVDTFGLVITAMGFGDERSFLVYPRGHAPSVHPFCGYPFWSHDPLENPNLSWTPIEARPRVLISGAGDGALQDFLRIVTRFKSARDLWDHLPLMAAQRAAVQKAAQDIEDQAYRAMAWSANADHDHAALDRLMTGSWSLAALIYGMSGVQASLSTAVRHDFSTLWFVHVCSHFGAGYALNRLLSLLLIQYLGDTSRGFTYKPGYRLVEIECLPPHAAPPTPDPRACHWQPHRATFWPKPDCAPVAPPPPPIVAKSPDQVEEEFDVLVLRHGIQAPPLFWAPGSAIRLPPTRQMLPYHHPG
jgi:hypothetical protein